MTILGIDPGTTAIGWAVVENPQSPKLIDAGLFTITSRERGEQLSELYSELFSLIKRTKPHIAAIEKLFFAKNTKTAMAVSETRGVILLTAALAKISVREYTPLEVKRAVTGDGAADKFQVRKMVQLILKETARLNARDDVFDAIALALTCAFKEKGRTNMPI